MRKQLLAAILMGSQTLLGCESAPPTQQAPATPKTYQSAIDKKPLDVKYFKPEMEKAAREMSSPLVTHCMNSETVDALKQCFRRQLDLGFDPSGKGRQACREIAEINPYSECIIVGNLVDDLRRRLPPGQEAPMAESDWLQPRPYLEKISVKLALSVMNQCLEANAGDVGSCQRTAFARVLQVSGKLQQRCDAIPANNDFITCVGEAYALQFINAGTARMNSLEL